MMHLKAMRSREPHQCSEQPAAKTPHGLFESKRTAGKNYMKNTKTLTESGKESAGVVWRIQQG